MKRRLVAIVMIRYLKSRYFYNGFKEQPATAIYLILIGFYFYSPLLGDWTFPNDVSHCCSILSEGRRELGEPSFGLNVGETIEKRVSLFIESV